MYNYVQDFNSPQTWGPQATISYTFSTSFNKADFDDDLTGVTITNNGNTSGWQQAMAAMEAVALVNFEPASSPANAQLGLLTGTITGTSAGVGYRNPTSGTVTSGLSVMEIDQPYLYMHELLHVLGLNHPGGPASSGNMQHLTIIH